MKEKYIYLRKINLDFLSKIGSIMNFSSKETKLYDAYQFTVVSLNPGVEQKVRGHSSKHNGQGVQKGSQNGHVIYGQPIMSHHRPFHLICNLYVMTFKHENCKAGLSRKCKITVRTTRSG